LVISFNERPVEMGDRSNFAINEANPQKLVFKHSFVLLWLEGNYDT
jgi:hypothetical protein